MFKYLALALLVASPAAASDINTASRISTQVNHQIVYVPEAPGQDNWRIATSEGDCEDFALLKRELFIAAGIPANKIHIVMLQDYYTRYGHVIVTIKQGSLTYFFDDRESKKSFPKYLEETNQRVYCEIADLTPGNKPGSKRCKR